MVEKLNIDQIIPINSFSGIVIDPVYTYGLNNKSPLFNQFPSLYHEEAKIIWGHSDIVEITLLASKICAQEYGWRLRVADCLRPVEAQEKMKQYGFCPSLVSRPGEGAHPRAMAIDIVPEMCVNGTWKLVDMGVCFDHFAPNPSDENPAARAHTRFDGELERSAKVFLNRQRLEFAMQRAAAALDQDITPLPQEWWDFRLPEEKFERYAPLKDSDLAPYQRVLNPDVEAVRAILKKDYPAKMREKIDRITCKIDRLWKASFCSKSPLETVC